MIYQPREDSFLTLKALRSFGSLRGKSVLDVGTGSGILAIEAKRLGAEKVVASDISDEGFELIRSHGVETIKSDLFERIKGRFDLIIFNAPYLPADEREDEESARHTTAGKQGDEIICRFLEQASQHLARKGVILLTLSSLTPKERILKLIDRKNMGVETIAKEKFFFEEIYVWQISVE
ncbi:DUF2431 domain-containing protein [Candidatus Pacearchaeota archaeon]|nr:MAG: DUF2431 domain-containing protein [Candidatus Pacearchaeota archaeon]